MKFRFKIQQYQTEAVEAITRVFQGQPHYDKWAYQRYIGLEMPQHKEDTGDNPTGETGYRNADLQLTPEQLLRNVQSIQNENNIRQSKALVGNLGHCSLDIEMETGTGKTYVYIKTMFELHKLYGWSKYIVVVPSIAIREGVRKSFEITTDHFMEQYQTNARFFVYNSANLNELEQFSISSKINVMIINMQAFASSLKEDGRSKEARIIYSSRDDFQSRRPIDAIAANRPIIILDEPQKMGGEVTQKALQNFNPLFCLNYSATHAKEHNLVYVLDALDAYNKKLVKKIEVKGFEVHNLAGTNQYLYLDRIVLSPDKAPEAKLEIEIAQKAGVVRKLITVTVGDDLYTRSNRMEQYKEGYVVTEIAPEHDAVVFSGGMAIHPGEAVGDIVESDMRRIQIRETIQSHFEKEERLFAKGIKTLSLFFIDEVAKYRQYDDQGEELLGEYGKMFEEEYRNVLEENKQLFNTEYQEYLNSIDTAATHKGYFSIDKKTGRSINSALKRGAEFSDDITAYDLILKNKERLLSFDEPTRFIFSHSALREGWDNPNVFQICTLKHSDSTTQKRQEVGRGLRLCVDQAGNRMDSETLGESIHDTNKLTVIASESYKTFVNGLQTDIRKVLYERPSKATSDYFKGKFVTIDGRQELIGQEQADRIEHYLIANGYIDADRKVTDKFRNEKEQDTLAPMPQDITPMKEGIIKLIDELYNDSALENMIDKKTNSIIYNNKLNSNFYKKEFQDLWKKINHKYAYTVYFESDELIQKSIEHIDKELFVSQPSYTVSQGEQTDEMQADTLDRGETFTTAATRTTTLKNRETSQIKYDLVGKIAGETVLTRRTVVKILKGISAERFALYRINPEEFISKVARIIREQKATMIVNYISYNQIEGKYDSDIFTAGKTTTTYDKAYKAKKHILQYVITDGLAEKSVERRFAQELDDANEVCVYAKLPRGFHIPTPMGNYSPDWAIAFNKETVKHIFFIAETKGSMESMQLRAIEKAKISCAKKLFNEISTENVKYHDVSSYRQLLEIMNKL